MSRTNKGVWGGVNKCVVCGTKLKFTPSAMKDAKDDEGERYCEHNHRRFSVYGRYDTEGDWSLWFRMPLKSNPV